MYQDNYFTTLQGVAMPPMIYGTAWKKERTEPLVYQAVKAGFRGIDTACQPRHYHEAGVGDALQKLFDEGVSREELFIQTKFTPQSGQDPATIPYDPSAPLADQVAESFDVSKRNLRCGVIDSLVLHSPLFPFSSLMQVWQAMETIQQKGEAKQLGISNCYELSWLKKLYEEARVKPSVVQNRFYLDSDYDIELRDWCRKHGIIYQSFWTLTANPYLLSHPLIQTAAEGLKREPAQILYRYLTQTGAAPLNGTTSAEHMKKDLESFSFELDSDTLGAITQLLDELAGH